MATFKKGLIKDSSEGIELEINFSELFDPLDPVTYLGSLVDELDVSKIEHSYKPIGQNAYPPKILLRIIFYGYTQGIRSGRKLEQACKTDLRFVYLSEGLRPSKTTLNEFRKIYHSMFEELFKQTLSQAIERGLTSTDRLYGDGTKIRAHASKKRSKTLKQYKKWLGHLHRDISNLEAALSASPSKASQVKKNFRRKRS